MLFPFFPYRAAAAPAPSLLIGIPSQAEVVEKRSGMGAWLSHQSEHLLLGVSRHCLTHSAWSSSGSYCLLDPHPKTALGGS